jgi:hypothetical protein
LSALAWIAFIVCAIAVMFRYTTTGDTSFLLYAIPGLAMLLIIPLTLSWMSRKSFREASEEYDAQARFYKIRKIDLGMAGTVVRIAGNVRKTSFKWLNRPHFQIEDGTGRIRVIMFTAPMEDIKLEDKVEVLGLVMKNIFARTTPVISAVSIKKID